MYNTSYLKGDGPQQQKTTSGSAPFNQKQESAATVDSLTQTGQLKTSPSLFHLQVSRFSEHVHIYVGLLLLKV